MIELVCRTALVIVMALAAIGKLRAPGELVGAMRAMGLPRRISHRAGAVVVALAELTAAVTLVLAPVAGYLIALGLVAGFTAGLVSAIHRRTTESCRCFGASAQPIGPSHLVRNAVLLAIAVTGLATLGPGDRPWLALIPGALLSLAIVAWDELAFAFTSPPAKRTPARTGRAFSVRRAK